MQLSLRITPDCGVTPVPMVKLSCGGQNFESMNLADWIGLRSQWY